MSGDLAGRRVLVTGASSGMGAGIARTLVHQGARVAMVARRADRLEQLAEELGPAALPFPCDVRDLDAVQRTASTAAQALEGLDGIVTNAGSVLVGHVGSGDPHYWKQYLETDVLGVLATLRYGLAEFADGEGGDVVLIGSSNTQVAFAEAGVYGAAKGAIARLAESLRLELLPRGIRVCLVEPGFTATEMPLSVVNEGVDPVSMSEGLGTDIVPLQPSDIADLVAFVMTRPANVRLNHLLVRAANEIRP